MMENRSVTELFPELLHKLIMRKISAAGKIVFVEPAVTGRNALQAEFGFFHQPAVHIKIVVELIIRIVFTDEFLDFVCLVFPAAADVFEFLL